MTWITPLVVAVSAYMIPVWYLTELAASIFEARKTRKGLLAQIVLRVLPPVVAFLLARAYPPLLVWLFNGFEGVQIVEPLTTEQLAFFGLVTGAAAVQLHQWKIPQALGGMLQATIRQAGPVPKSTKPDGEEPPEEESVK